MSRRQPSPPSHLTRAQTRRHLAASKIALSKSTVWELTQKGQPLEGETWDGTLMIPRWRINAFIEAREKREA